MDILPTFKFVHHGLKSNYIKYLRKGILKEIDSFMLSFDEFFLLHFHGKNSRDKANFFYESNAFLHLPWQYKTLNPENSKLTI